jgi:hypothetical protein
LEKVLPPDGTDRSPYYLRDLGTIFFVQVAAQLLLMTETLGSARQGQKAATDERSSGNGRLKVTHPSSSL